jgi:cytochrome o ubiquinol oxidase subunit 1
MVSLVIGKFSTAGWTGYPPYSGIEYNPGVGVDYWIWAILIAGVGSTMSGINFIVTILKMPGAGHDPHAHAASSPGPRSCSTS